MYLNFDTPSVAASGTAAVGQHSESSGACCSECATAARGSGLGFVSTAANDIDWSWLYWAAAGIAAVRVLDLFTSPKSKKRRRK